MIIICNATVETVINGSEDDEMVHLEVVAGEGGYAYGTGEYPCGIMVKTSARPMDGYYFVRWSDGDTSEERNIVIMEGMTIKAYFEESSRGIINV